MIDEGRDAGGYTPGQIKALKIAIAIMTFAIVAGLAVLVLTIAYRAANHKPVAAVDGARTDLSALYPNAGPIAEALLPAGARITAISPWGDKLLLAVEDAGGASVLVLDPKTAKIEPLARLRPAP